MILNLARVIDSELHELLVSPTDEVDCIVNMFTEKDLKTTTRLPRLPPANTDLQLCVDENRKHALGAG